MDFIQRHDGYISILVCLKISYNSEKCSMAGLEH